MNLKQFVDRYVGRQVEFHSFGGPETYYQCTDLVNQYIKEVLGLTPVIGTNAKDFPDKINRVEFDAIRNTPDFIPVMGDIPVWNGRVGGGAGHIAVVLDDDSTLKMFTSVDQNWSLKQQITIEEHNYNNVSYFLRPKEVEVSDKVELDPSKFEELVTKASRWDEVLKAGYTSVAQINQEVTQLKKSASDAQARERTERERADNARKDLNNLIATVAKALNTQQEIVQIEAALQRVSKQLDELEDLERQYAALQTNSGQREEELRAEISRLEELVRNSGSLAGATMEQLLTEIIRRFKNILMGRNV